VVNVAVALVASGTTHRLRASGKVASLLQRATGALLDARLALAGNR
jgi:hypothetical protein